MSTTRQSPDELQKVLLNAESDGSAINGAFGESDRYMDKLNRGTNSATVIFTPLSSNIVANLFARKKKSVSGSEDGPIVELVKEYVKKVSEIGLIQDQKTGGAHIVKIRQVFEGFTDAEIVKLLDKTAVDFFRKNEKTLRAADKKLQSVNDELMYLKKDSAEFRTMSQQRDAILETMAIETQTPLYSKVMLLADKTKIICDAGKELTAHLTSMGTTPNSIFHANAKPLMDKLIDSTVLSKELSQFKFNLLRDLLVSSSKLPLNSDKAKRLMGENTATELAKPYIRLNNLVDDSLRILNSYKPDNPPNPQRIAMLEALATKLKEITTKTIVNPQHAAEDIMGTLKNIAASINKHESSRNFVSRNWVLATSDLYRSVNNAIAKYPEMNATPANDMKITLSQSAQDALKEMTSPKKETKLEKKEEKTLFTRVGPR